MVIQKRKANKVVANSEVAAEAAELLFETQDVADLIAEVTGEAVTVEADGTVATFEIGDEVFTVEGDEDDEVVEASTKFKKRPVKASHAPNRSMNGRSVRKMPRRK